MSNLTSFVKEKLPEFVRVDHPMFETFMGAYYEWMEYTNTGTSTSNKDLYKQLPNPYGIIGKIEEYLDIDETLTQFIDFFANELVPVTIENIKADPKFFLKKTRELYLAKGTPKSFELFFKIFFNEEIDVYETKDSILRASDGKYLSFPVAHFYIEEFEENLSKFDFSFSTFNDSDSVLSVILQGSTIDKNPITDTYIIKIIFADLFNIERNKAYTIIDTTNNISIIVKPLLSIENIKPSNPGALYNANDSVVFKSNTFRKNFISSISSITTGRVDEVVVRNRGYLYQVGDKFKFNLNDKTYGTGGGFSITSVDSEQSIVSVDNIDVRSGYNNQGWLSNSFESAYVPIKNGGYWSKLPETTYNPILSIDRTVNFDDTYLQSQGFGLGAQVTPISHSIGQIDNINFNQSPYFLDSDDLSFVVPANIVVENLDYISEGDIINFRYWKDFADYQLDDSEEIIYYARVYSNFYFINDLTDSDSESTVPVDIKLAYDFDSDTFNWKAKEYSIYSYLKDSEMWQAFESDLDLSTLNNTRKYSFNNDTVLDGGNSFGFSSANPLDGGNGFSDPSADIIDGGETFSFSRSVYHEIQIRFNGIYISEMDSLQFEKLNQLSKSTLNSYTYLEIDSEIKTNLRTLADVGSWQNTGKYAQVKRIDGNVLQILPYSTYDILTDSELQNYISGKYDLVRIESVYENDLSVKDEDYSPFQNIVHSIKQGSITFDIEIISRRDKLFWDESGFLSSASNSVLQDSYYYSDYTYNITSNVPYTEWKTEFRKTLHPAGMVLTATAVINSEVNGNLQTNIETSYQPEKQNLTFDSMLEYGEDPRPYIFTENFQISEDNIVHRIEEFNEANKELGLGWIVSSDDLKFATNAGFRQQKGDSWWDYEPLGWVNANSSQDSDGFGKVKAEVKYYEPARDFHRQNGRYGIEFPAIFKTEFTLTTDSEYDVIDSDLPADLFARISDSDNGFKKIDYSRLAQTNDNKAYQQYSPNRKFEIKKIKANDLELATRENNSLVFTDKNGTYYDYEAYDKKWNENNTRRFTHEAGWIKSGYISYYQNEFVNEANTNRTNLKFGFEQNNVSTESGSYNAAAFEGGNTFWRNNYGDRSVINIIENISGTQDYRDPKVSMKGRKG